MSGMWVTHSLWWTTGISNICLQQETIRLMLYQLPSVFLCSRYMCQSGFWASEILEHKDEMKPGDPLEVSLSAEHTWGNRGKFPFWGEDKFRSISSPWLRLWRRNQFLMEVFIMNIDTFCVSWVYPNSIFNIQQYYAFSFCHLPIGSSNIRIQTLYI